MLQQVFDFGAIVLADLMLPGDNALVMATAAIADGDTGMMSFGLGFMVLYCVAGDVLCRAVVVPETGIVMMVGRISS
ncbi:hypothetical protein SAMN05877838_1897 [Hoeflea halophila]|uniref:LysE type translocator n=1 Tax=Hoeflea halophila TaxID=714899 RepID=A0A286IA95_9HYPH|nr:hypothetical protein [Hoeflea halophila]SOE17010.1 hypothetical protein SAMN05877838_1897 [Hoeflea halophila]